MSVFIVPKVGIIGCFLFMASFAYAASPLEELFGIALHEELTTIAAKHIETRCFPGTPTAVQTQRGIARIDSCLLTVNTKVLRNAPVVMTAIDGRITQYSIMLVSKIFTTPELHTKLAFSEWLSSLDKITGQVSSVSRGETLEVEWKLKSGTIRMLATDVEGVSIPIMVTYQAAGHSH